MDNIQKSGGETNSGPGDLDTRVEVRACVDDDQEFCFQTKKKALGVYIEQAYGWDEPYQRQLYVSTWAITRDALAIVLFDQKPAGTIEIREESDKFCLGEFYLLPEFQQRGIGGHLLAKLLATADAAHRPIELGVLKNNPARRLYERHGFVVTGESDYFYQMRRDGRAAS